MTRTIACAGLIALSWSGAWGQSFEVASIKPGNPDSHMQRTSISVGGRLNAENISLRTLIEDAYQLKSFQLSGGPKWLDSDKFEVIAKGADASSEAQIRLMLQALLAERFHLTMHHETREQTISVLTLKDPSKLQHAREDGRYRMMTSTSGRGAASNHVSFKNTSMEKLADILSREMNRLVVDQTGLTGEFDFEGEVTRDENEPNPFTVMLDTAMPQFGLKLESKKGPVEFFVVDRAEKPSGN